MIKSISVPIAFHFKVGKKGKWKRSKRMAEVTVNLSAKLTRFSKACVFLIISLKSMGLTVQSLFKK